MTTPAGRGRGSPGPDPGTANPGSPGPDPGTANPGSPGPDPGTANPGSPGRDRDTSGRPRNARPRDALGRPLRRGDEGEERVPGDLVLPPPESLAVAQELLDRGRPFHAHEVLEASWKAAPPPERDLWQGLAQIAVGLTHASRGNARGAAALLRRGGERIGPYGSTAPHGIDAAALARQAAGLAARIERDGIPEVISVRLIHPPA